MFSLFKRTATRNRHICIMLLRVVAIFSVSALSLLADSITTPLPADIALRLAVRADAARKNHATVRAYLLYTEAAKLDPLNSNYRQNREELEPISKLLLAQKLESADVQADIAVCKLEATPGSDANIAVRLADKAERERRAGHAVKAYLLYSAAASRFPDNVSYRENRNTLAPVAALLRNSNLETPDVTADVKAAELESLAGPDPSVRAVGGDWQTENSLAALPHIQANTEHHDFDIKGTSATLIAQVTSVYGVRAITDPELPKSGTYSLKITDADFRAAMDALTAVTGTFVFPVSQQVVFFAEDTEAKRNDLEPNILLTVSLPDSLGDKDLIEVANGVKSVLNLKSFGWDSANHTVLIRDRFTRAHLAKSLLESLLVPHAQVALELQFITVDSDTVNHWGLSPQTSFQLLSPAQKLFNFNVLLPTVINGLKYIAFGGGLGTMGVGITSAEMFATFSKSLAKTTYDTTVIIEDGQTANLHVGEKYPIPQSLYTGAAQSAPSIYNPIGTFTQEDLGLVLKVTPHVKGDGEVGMDIEADYKALGTQTFNTVPSISERKFSSSITLRTDQWAVLAGLDQTTNSSSRDGFPGLSSIPGLNQILSENNREKQTSETLIVLKPQIRRLPMSDAITPQFLIGPIRGVRVLL